MKDCPMSDFKSQADQRHDRLIANLEAKEQRQIVTLRLPVNDARVLIRNISSRAEWFRNRREPDPLMKAMARQEADRCDKIANKIGAAVKGVS